MATFLLYNLQDIVYAASGFLYVFIPLYIGFNSDPTGAVTAATTNPNSWYRRDAASFSPTGWVFGLVWTLLYPLMGVAAWFDLIAMQEQNASIGLVTAGQACYWLQLLLNSTYICVFFVERMYSRALMNLGVQMLLVAGAIVLFFIADWKAGVMMCPLELWLFFATSLNIIFVYNSRQRENDGTAMTQFTIEEAKEEDTGRISLSDLSHDGDK